MNVPPESLARARNLIAEKLGIVVAVHQEDRLRAALADLGALVSACDVGPVLAALAEGDVEGTVWQRIASHLTVGETCFFRHREWFSTIENEVLRSLIDERRRCGQRALRLWSAGCATGEEAYSLAIAIARLIPDLNDWNVLIKATDINPVAIRTARQAVYRPWALRETSLDTMNRFFAPQRDGLFAVDTRIKSMIELDILNLAGDRYPTPATGTVAMDLILCRNVIMYFAPEVQARVAGRLHDALGPGGWLAVSPAEAAADLFHPLRPVNFRSAILFRKQNPLEPQLERRRSNGKLPAVKRPHSPKPIDGHVVAPVSRQRPIDASAKPLPAPGRRLAQAQALADAGRLRDARVACEAIVAADPMTYGGHVLLAAICEEDGDLPSAAATLRQAVYLRPDSPEAGFMLASLLFRLGEVARGCRHMRKVLDGLEHLPPDAVVLPDAGMTVAAIRELATAYLTGSSHDGERTEAGHES